MGTGFTADEKLQFIEEKIKNIQGDIAEIGCWKGSTSHRLVKISHRLNCRLHLFDSFEGMDTPDSEKDTDHYPKGKFDIGGVPGFQKQMRDIYGVTSHEYTCHQGYIPACFEGCDNLKFRFCYLDVDVYVPTKYSLTWVWPKLAKGGLLMLDDIFLSREQEASLAWKEWSQENEGIFEEISFENNQKIIVKL